MNNKEKWMATANRYPRMRGADRLGEYREAAKARTHQPKIGGKARAKVSNTFNVENFTHRKMW